MRDNGKLALISSLLFISPKQEIKLAVPFYPHLNSRRSGCDSGLLDSMYIFLRAACLWLANMKLGKPERLDCALRESYPRRMIGLTRTSGRLWQQGQMWCQGKIQGGEYTYLRLTVSLKVYVNTATRVPVLVWKCWHPFCPVRNRVNQTLPLNSRRAGRPQMTWMNELVSARMLPVAPFAMNKAG